MQIFQSSLKGATRPCAPEDCARCGGRQKLHRHGAFPRYGAVKGAGNISVQRFLCPRCGHTWSVIAEGMFPYRSLAVARFQALMDERFGLAGGSARPPPATEIEEGCIRRACKVLLERIPLLRGLFGQQMPLLTGEGIGGFWRALRELGSTGKILVALARDFKTSLLGCYASLRPHWAREGSPACASGG